MTAPTDQLLSAFMDAWNAGRRPRLEDFVEQAPASEQPALARAIADFVELAPTPDYDDAALAAIRAEPNLAIAMAATERPFAQLVSEQREAAGITVPELATELTTRLDLRADDERVETYLGRLERGELDPRRFARRLLDALASALGADRAVLGAAGRLGPAPAGALFRYADDSVDPATVHARLDAITDAMLAPAPADRDEVDELFLGPG